MAGKYHFLNVLTSATASGNISLQLQTYTASTNVIVNITCTGITSGMGPEAIASQIYPQIGTQLQQYNALYSGQPTFSNQLGAPTFRVSRSQWIISFFSEAEFSIDITSGTGAIMSADEVPAFTIVSKMRSMGPFLGVPIPPGISDSDLGELIVLASSVLVNVANNYVVITSYIKEDTGWMQRSFFLKYPGISLDGVRVRYASSNLIYWIQLSQFTSYLYNWKKDTGELQYMVSQNVIENGEPSGWQNELKISYMAGSFHIPPQVFLALCTALRGISEGTITSNVKSLKTGTWSVNFRDTNIFQTIAEQMGDLVLYV